MKYGVFGKGLLLKWFPFSFALKGGGWAHEYPRLRADIGQGRMLSG